MSRLNERNSSRLNVFSGSRLNVFGVGVETHAASFTDQLTMSWDVDYYLYNATLGTTTAPASASIEFNGEFFRAFALGWGTSNQGGHREHNAWSGQAFTGSPAPATDTYNVNGLTYPNTTHSAGNFQWNGWTARGSEASAVNLTDTGSQIILRGEIGLFSLNGSQSASNILTYGPWLNLVWDGFNWVRSTTLDHIMFYITGLGGTIDDGTGGPDIIQLYARVKVTINA